MRSAGFLYSLFSYLCIFMAAILVFYVFAMQFSGLDFTDESFYLMWLSDPKAYNFTKTHFGIVYHPLYLLLDGNIVGLRIFNVLSVWSLASTLFYFLLNQFDLKKWESIAFSILLGMISLQQFKEGVFTPSYNSLNLISLLIVSIGIVLIGTKSNIKNNYVVVLFITIGGWLCFLAKPSSAFLLAFWCLFFFVGVQRGSGLKIAIISGVLSLTLLYVFLLFVFGGIVPTVERLKVSYELGKQLAGGHELLSIIRYDKLVLGRIELLFSGGILFFSLFLYYVRSNINSAKFIILCYPVFIFMCSILIGLIPSYPKANLSVVVIPIFFTFIALVKIVKKEFLFDFKVLLTFFLFLTLPCIYAFGTNNNYWNTFPSASVFWLFASVYLILKSCHFSNNELRAVLGSGMCLVLLIISNSVASMNFNPYRQPKGYLSYNYPSSNERLGNLYFTKEVSQYIKDISHTKDYLFFEKGTRVIDLSGRSPGVVYLLGGLGFGEAWNLGGYTGSENKMKLLFSKFDCKSISKAWIFMEEDGIQPIDYNVINSYGATLDDYVLMASFASPNNLGGSRRSHTQKLLSPKSEKIKHNCELSRKDGRNY